MKMLIFINVPNCLTKKLQEGSKEWGGGVGGGREKTCRNAGTLEHMNKMGWE